jgi:hypothetical protein
LSEFMLVRRQCRDMLKVQTEKTPVKTRVLYPENAFKKEEK